MEEATDPRAGESEAPGLGEGRAPLTPRAPRRAADWRPLIPPASAGAARRLGARTRA